MVDILRDEISKIETKQLYVFNQSLRNFLLYFCYFAFSSFFFVDSSTTYEYQLCDYRQLLGKDLSGLGIKELQNLEQQLSEGLLSVKARKVTFYSIPFPFLYVLLFFPFHGQ